MNTHFRMISLVVALAVVLVVGIMAQQKSADTAIDPVCGMTVVKANAKATFDYKGTTYYFCSTGCKEAFAKEPEKYLEAKPQPKPAMAGTMGGMMHPMHQGMAAAPAAPAPGHMGMGTNMGMRPMMRGMGMMPRGMAMAGHGAMAPLFGPLFRLYGDKIEVTVENGKDGAALKMTSKDPEVVKAIQVHMAEHVAMMKEMREAASKAPTPATGIK